MRTLHVSFEDRYRVDPEQLGKLLSSATTLVSLASPQNPSGVAIPNEALQQVLQALRAKSPPEPWTPSVYACRAVHGSVTKPGYSVSGLRICLLWISSARSLLSVRLCGRLQWWAKSFRQVLIVAMIEHTSTFKSVKYECSHQSGTRCYTTVG